MKRTKIEKKTKLKKKKEAALKMQSRAKLAATVKSWQLAKGEDKELFAFQLECELSKLI